LNTEIKKESEKRFSGLTIIRQQNLELDEVTVNLFWLNLVSRLV
jgi:hypothetical protein